MGRGGGGGQPRSSCWALVICATLLPRWKAKSTAVALLCPMKSHRGGVSGEVECDGSTPVCLSVLPRNRSEDGKPRVSWVAL